MAPRLIHTGVADLIPMVRTGDPGAHISVMIKSLCLRLGHFEESEVDEETRTRWELGSAFEDTVANSLAIRHAANQPGRYSYIGELEMDGLIGTPDLGDMIDRAIIEIKLTWMSSKHSPESDKFWKYWVQAKAYAHMMGWNICRIHVCHVMGNYKYGQPGSGPTYNVWEDTFTDKELRMNWKMLLNERERMKRDGGS